MAGDLVKIATVENIYITFNIHDDQDNSRLVQSLLETEGYDFGGAQLTHALVHDRVKLRNLLSTSGNDFIYQLDVIISSALEFRSDIRYTLQAQADDECRKTVRGYKEMVHDQNLNLPYYTITSPESYARFKGVLESEGFRVEDLQRRGNISSTRNLTRH